MTTRKNLEVIGNLHDHPLAELLTEIGQSALNGALRISAAGQKIIIYFDGGEIVFAVSNARQHRLYNILLREKKLAPGQLAGIPGFINDLNLKTNLIQNDLLPEHDVNAYFSMQIREILLDALTWQEGNWSFSSLVRAKADIRFRVETADMLFHYGRQIQPENIIRRFKSLEERFAVRSGMPVYINLLPAESFVFSRFENESLSVEEIKGLCGLAEREILKTLYILWLGGFLVRQKWDSAFSREKMSAILSAKIELKQPAFVPQTASEKPDAPVADQEAEIAEAAEEEKISLEEYLERTEQSVTHYEALDVPPEADFAQIKAAYFLLAKRFHPDLFHRRIEDLTHRRIQKAFTEIAQAYETLRNPEVREVYDFKLRKEISTLSSKKRTDNISPQETAELLERQALENFEQGYDLLMEDNCEEAVAYLARAVHLADGNARYHAYYGKALAYDKTTYRQAEAEFQAALRVEPDNLDYRLMLAELFIKIGLVKRAEGELSRILEKSPANYEARSLLDSLLTK